MRAGRFHSALLIVALSAGAASAQSIGRAAPSEPEFGERLFAIKFTRFHLYRMFHSLAESLTVEAAQTPATKPIPKLQTVESAGAVALPPKPRTVWPPIALAMLQQSVQRSEPAEAVLWIAPPTPPANASAAQPKEAPAPRPLPPPLGDIQWNAPKK